ncbi:S-layer protein [Thermococcus nautili]|uniref:S-layer protein n=1 Tax=Thermococcus nautili TaxID=195522 RepID=W8P3C1_9EURY|nr:S-layer protein [Thermococcus nautili]AHL21920.1 S-layer protein precursor [Thermococcus nautili]CAI1494041.1 S-layer protein [Thermococcus nautili]
MKVKKIAALAVGAAMIGATIGFASATTDVQKIPKSFFVKSDGTPNVKIVVGSNAAAMDVASAADIAVALGSLLYTTKQVEAQNAYVKVKAEYPPETEAMWTIYAYNFTTINATNDGNITSWATSYDELPGTYWWNGADSPTAYTYNYTEFVENFNVPVTLTGKDKAGDYSIDWHVTIANPELKSIDPSNWTMVAPPKKADIVVEPGKLSILVDYVLYNYSVTTTETTYEGEPEWGAIAKEESVTNYYIGDAEEVAANGGTIVDEVFPGVSAGMSFTVFGKEYNILEVGNGTFTAGMLPDDNPMWYEVGQSKTIPGTNWVVTVLDINLQETRALVIVKDAATGAQTGQVILDKNAPKYFVEEDGQVEAYDSLADAGYKADLVLKLEDTFVGIDNHIIASIYAEYDIQTLGPVFHPADGWNATVNTALKDGTWYITNITLVNDKTLEGNPIDVFGVYDLKYKYEEKAYDKYYNPATGEFVAAPEGKQYIVAYAYICLKEKEGKVVEKELKVGDQIPDSDYTIEGIYATATTVEPKPVTEPIVYMDYEINVNDPGSNLILVGGPVANSVTKYLVEHNVSKVDWYNSAGDVEYLQDALGGYDVVIVAGATRNETRVAAEKLMKHIAELAKE